jgi:hypothetical protein
MNIRAIRSASAGADAVVSPFLVLVVTATSGAPANPAAGSHHEAADYDALDTDYYDLVSWSENRTVEGGVLTTCVQVYSATKLERVGTNFPAGHYLWLCEFPATWDGTLTVAPDQTSTSYLIR